MTRQDKFTGRKNRRTFLVSAATIGATALSGCSGLIGGGDDETDTDSNLGLIGYERDGRDAPGGTSMADLPDLSGELDVYSGRGQFLVGELVRFIDDLYDDLTLDVRYERSNNLVNQILNEGSGTPADVFYSVNAGSLGALADADRTQSLSSDIRDMVRPEFQTEQWIGTSGRARSVPYNTNSLSADGLSDDIMTYAENPPGDLGWAPSYGSAQAFITAMRVLEGEDATLGWLEGVVDSGISTYPDELATCRAIANGEIDAGFTNHYYIQRVLNNDSEAPIATSFTDGDAGAVFNVAGGAVIDEAADPELSENFLQHLLSAEAQDYFARSTFEYPLIPDVEPVGDLPSIDELDVPDIDLTQLSDIEPTIDLMRDAGINV